MHIIDTCMCLKWFSIYLQVVVAPSLLVWMALSFYIKSLVKINPGSASGLACTSYTSSKVIIRKHPFNLKGGAMVFFGKKISVGKFDGEKFLSLTWAEKNILFALWALKILFL